MKYISLIGEVAWDITSFLLWLSAIISPAWCLILIISIFFNILDGHVSYDGFPIETIGEKIYLLFVFSFMSAVGLQYVLKYRKLARDRNDLKYIFIIFLLIYILLTLSYQNYHYKKRLDKVDVTNVSIECFD